MHEAIFIAAIAVTGGVAVAAVAFAWRVVSAANAQVADALRLLASRDYGAFASSKRQEAAPRPMTADEVEAILLERERKAAENSPHSMG